MVYGTSLAAKSFENRTKIVFVVSSVLAICDYLRKNTKKTLYNCFERFWIFEVDENEKKNLLQLTVLTCPYTRTFMWLLGQN